MDQSTRNMDTSLSLSCFHRPQKKIKKNGPGGFLLWRYAVVVFFCCGFVNAQEQQGSSSASKGTAGDNNSKEYQICSIAGGVAVAREISRNIQTLFLNSLEDVEYMREILTETMEYNAPKSSITLEELSQTLDYEVRGLPSNWTTVDAGLGYVDDNVNRRVDLFAGLEGDPSVGSKEADLVMMDILSPILPWILDRRSQEDYWWLEHQNNNLGTKANENGDEDSLFDRLYLAAYAVTWSNCAAYYPPMTVYVPTGGFTLLDVLGCCPNMRGDASVIPILPENNPSKQAVIGTPYADRANPGVSIVSALAPIYYTGSWYGFENYNDTNLGLVGIDISITSMSRLLHQLDGTVAGPNSFGLLVDKELNVYVITQPTVEKIYPPRTGFEDYWVHRDESGEGQIVDDRRNMTYLVSDTILQPPTNLTNANWKMLRDEIASQPSGHRGFTTIDIVLTGDTNPTSYFVIYDKWTTVGDFTLMVFAPQHEVENAMKFDFEETEIRLETTASSDDGNDDGLRHDVSGQVVFQNKGIMDIVVSLKTIPHWISLGNDAPLNVVDDSKVGLNAGEDLLLPFTADENKLPIGLTSSLLTLAVEDDDYSDCYFSQELSATITIQVYQQEDLQQLGSFRIYGFAIGGIVVATSIYFSIWVWRNSNHAIVKASQPIFLYILGFGTFVLGVSIFPLSIDDSLASDEGCTVACMIFPWLFFLGFGISFAAMFSKIWRIHRLMRASIQFQRENITARDVMMPLCVICTIDITLLLIWTIADPQVWERVQEDDGGSSSYGTCWYDMSTVQITCLSLLTVVNLLALVLANIQAYRARSIADEFSESKYIFLANFGMLQVMLVGTPVMFLVLESPQAFFFVRATLIFAIAWPLQLLIFLPKLFYVWKHAGDGGRSAIANATRSFIRHSVSKNFSSSHQQQESSQQASALSENRSFIGNTDSKDKNSHDSHTNNEARLSTSNADTMPMITHHTDVSIPNIDDHPSVTVSANS